MEQGPKPVGKQIDIDFEGEAQKAFEKKRDEIAEKYKVADKSIIVEKDGQILIGNLTPEEWENVHNNEGFEYHQGQK